MDTEQTSLNPSSLIDLKAELHKKYETFRKAKVIQNSEPDRQRTSLKRKGEPITKEKKLVPAVTKTVEENKEEELALKKSRLALEAKAKLYEKITSNNELIDEEKSELYLVDFNRKILYETPVTRQNTAESVQTNSPSDDDEVYSKTELKEIYERKNSPPSSCTDKNSDEKTNEESVHYQNVQFNEIRDHGTGYFAFSTDEAKRKEQMEELHSLRQQTEEQRLFSQKMQKKRKALLEARLAKVCERRNIDKNVIQKYTATQENEISGDPTPENIDLSSIPLPEPVTAPEKKEAKVRPWDVGKTEFISFVGEKRKQKTQRDWMEERRSERQSEFAPPSLYK